MDESKNALAGGEPTKARVEIEEREPEYSTGSTLDPHPACLLLPDMTAEDFGGLKADIEAHGLMRPILLCEGKILDGRHRARACAELGIVARFEQWTGADPVAFVLSENLHRRHLSASQRAMVAAHAMDWHKEQAQARQRSGMTLASREAKVQASGKSAATAGAAVGVSRASVERAAAILKAGTAEDVQEVLKGEATVNAKVRELAEREPKTTPRAPATPPKPTAKAKDAMQAVIAVTAALANLRQVADAIMPGEPALPPMVAALRDALERFAPAVENQDQGQGADHA